MRADDQATEPTLSGGLDLGEPRGARAAPASIARFELLRPLGTGGMGQVWLAFDPELEREVAIKQLAVGEGASEASRARARARFSDEARALARLSHPNVVQVHEVGEDQDGEPYIAMEYVRGRDFSAWIAAEEPSWAEILGRFMEVGEGLAAAHAAGLVHRDIKPSNLMVGDDGRARVIDFGLARRGTPQLRDSEGRGQGKGEGEGEARGLVGTPLFIAPELYAGVPADAASDQWALCVALYRCLWGEHPFKGSSLASLVRAAEDGELQPPTRREIPRSIYEVVARGLAPDPRDRFEDLAALLGALERARKRRRRAVLGLGGLLCLALAAGIGVASGRAQLDAPRCEELASALDGDWNPDRRGRLHARLVALAPGWGPAQAERVITELDRWAEDWRAARVRACEAPPEAWTDARLTCLGHHRRSLVATLDRLETPETLDAPALAGALELVETLPQVADCDEPERLSSRLPMPSSREDWEAVAATREQLERARAAFALGDYASARASLDAARRAAPSFEPVEVELELAAARLAVASGDPSAREALGEVVTRALATGHDLVAVGAWISLADELGQRDPSEALRVVTQAEALLERHDWLDARARIDLDLARALALDRSGDHAGALVILDRAVAAAADARSTRQRLVTLTRRANASLGLGDPARARADYRAALELVEAELGPQHPAGIEARVGLVELELAAPDPARFDALRRELDALEVELDQLGRGQPSARVVVALARTRLALIEGDLEHAGDHADAAVAACEGPGAPPLDCAQARAARGTIRFWRSDAAGAELDFAVAARLQTEALGPAAPEVALQRSNHGEALLALGRHEAAIVEFEAAIAVLRGRPLDEPTDLALPLKGLGQAKLARGEAEAAVAILDEALDLLSTAGPRDPVELADLRWALARALLARDGPEDRARARALGQAAHDAYVELGDDWAERRAELSAWLNAL